jgi:predicted transcriptional regulator
MKIADLVAELKLTVYSGGKGLVREIKGGYVSDLLSDVMGNAKEGQVWVTLQTHKNVLAVASLKDLAGIILVKGAKPDQDTIIKSDEEDIPVMGTDDDTFIIAGKLYEFLKY